MKIQVFLLLFTLSCLACKEEIKSEADSAPESQVQETQQEPVKVSLEEAQRLHDEEGYIYIDVRTPGEIKKGKIGEALEFDYKDKNWESKIQELDSNGKYIVYCHSGVRSNNACKKLKELNFINVVDMTDGYSGWSRQN